MYKGSFHTYNIRGGGRKEWDSCLTEATLCETLQWVLYSFVRTAQGFSRGSVVKNPWAKAGDTGSIPWLRKIPWRRKWQPTLVFLPGKSHGRRNWMGYSPWSCKTVSCDQQLVNKKVSITIIFYRGENRGSERWLSLCTKCHYETELSLHTFQVFLETIHN